MFNLRYKKAMQEIEYLKEENKKKQNKLEALEEFLSFYRSRKKASILISNAKKQCSCKKDFEKITMLEASMCKINYRDFITKTKKGEVIIDINQMYDFHMKEEAKND